MDEKNATVQVKVEFTILTPGGGEMFYQNGRLIPITDENRKCAETITFCHYPTAVEHCRDLNKALRDNGIDDRSYLVAKRTITKVTSAWEDSI